MSAYAVEQIAELRREVESLREDLAIAERCREQIHAIVQAHSRCNLDEPCDCIWKVEAVLP